MVRRETFTHLTKWLEEVKENGAPNINILLIGNKCDKDSELFHFFFRWYFVLSRAVTFEEGEKFAKENNLVFLETSALTSKNVEEVSLFKLN